MSGHAGCNLSEGGACLASVFVGLRYESSTLEDQHLMGLIKAEGQNLPYR
jgi:hypothetical protein